MNWQHLQAFVWLRWRLLTNQWRRGGTVNAVLMIDRGLRRAWPWRSPLFIGCFVLGLFAIPRAAPVHLLYAWDGLVVAFLFFWGIGLTDRPAADRDRCRCRSSCTCPSRSTGRS